MSGTDAGKQADDRGREQLDAMLGMMDSRVTAFFDTNWDGMERHLIDKLAERMTPELSAFIERRANEMAMATAGSGGGGANDTGAVNGSGGGGGGDGDAGFLADMPDGPAPVAGQRSLTERKAAAVGGLLALMEDPVGAIERLVDVGIKIVDRRKPPAALPAHPWDVMQKMAQEQPDLVSFFAPQESGLKEAMMAGARWGLDVAGVAAKSDVRGMMKKKAPPWEAGAASEPASVPEPVAAIEPEIPSPPELAPAAQSTRRLSLREMA